MPQISVIVPTFREADNLPILIPRIAHAAVRADIDFEIIVVDDNSPDATTQVCANLQEQYPVRLIVRKNERGLSSAVIAGMRVAEGELLVVMDADLSHPPEKIPELVAALSNQQVDFVIGSRYVTGAATADDWGLFRWLNSQVATALARPLTSARDSMAGFFALRRRDFLQVESTLDPIGYKIGLELIVKCRVRNIVEVPIVFADRLKGQSKLNWKEQVNYLRHLKRLYDHRYPNWSSLLQFSLVGCTGMVIDLSAFTGLLFVVSTAAARGLAIWLAMSWNFLLNRTLTFSSAQHAPMLRQYIAFCGSCMVGAVVNWSTSVSLCSVHPFFESHKVVAAMAGVVGGLAFNYLLCRHLVFRKRKTAKVPILPHTAIHGPHAGVPAANVSKSKSDVLTSNSQRVTVN